MPDSLSPLAERVWKVICVHDEASEQDAVRRAIDELERTGLIAKDGA